MDSCSTGPGKENPEAFALYTQAIGLVGKALEGYSERTLLELILKINKVGREEILKAFAELSDNELQMVKRCAIGLMATSIEKRNGNI
jgi:hypothetical protein